MTEQHAKYRAIGYETEEVAGGVRHKIWIHGTLRDFEADGAEQCIHHPETETLSQIPETELWFMNSVPSWIMLSLFSSN